jgi:amidohydrolase
MKDQAGREVGVMHACGHDVHMSILIGNARVLAELKHLWHGTLVLVAQPAEEGYGGARMMFDDGLYKRFPRPDYALALHVAPQLPAGSIGYTPGQAMAGTLSMKVTVRGIGGHGAIPQATKDPIVMAARLVMALQTIVSREIDPNEPAVITVGEIHGGTAANIIPDEVQLKLNLRFANEAVMNQLLEAIERECRGIAVATGLPENLQPLIERSNEVNPPVFNDPELTDRVTAKFREYLGDDRVFTIPLVTASEDFALFRDGEPPIKTFLFWLGITDPEFIRSISGRAGRLTEEEAGRITLHTPYVRPEQEPAIKTGMGAMCTAVFELMGTER